MHQGNKILIIQLVETPVKTLQPIIEGVLTCFGKGAGLLGCGGWQKGRKRTTTKTLSSVTTGQQYVASKHVLAIGGIKWQQVKP
jgi:hypothetical protein